MKNDRSRDFIEVRVINDQHAFYKKRVPINNKKQMGLLVKDLRDLGISFDDVLEDSGGFNEYF